MRVLHILNELKPSGAETMLRAGAAAFRVRGVDGEVLSTGTTVGVYAKQLESAGYSIRHIPFARSPAYLWRIYRFLAGEAYDAVHIHCERANFWYGLVARLAGVRRIVRTIHNNFQFTGGLGLRRKLQRMLLRWLGIRQVAIAPGVEETERRYLGNPTMLILNWYDSGRFVPPTESQRREARMALGLNEDQVVLVTVGNCSKIKNHAVLLESIAQLADRRDIVYLHVGLEDEGCRERDLAEQLGLGNCVRFLGVVEDVRAVLFCADIYVMPSLYEGFSIAAVEALAVGLPAVLADVSGLRDFKAYYRNLVYVPPRCDAVGEAIGRLRKLDPTVRRAMAADYPEVSRRQFGIERGVSQYVELYLR
jgi:glycosyltransferase involved in cell wall biosynthesis